MRVAKHPNQWQKDVKVERVEENKGNMSYQERVDFNVKKISNVYAGEKKLAALQSKTLGGEIGRAHV